MHSITHIHNVFVKNIVPRIIAIVLSFEVDCDVSLIYHKRIDFCKKLTLVRLVPFQYFS